MDNSNTSKVNTIGRYFREKKKLTRDDFNFVEEDLAPIRQRWIDSLKPKGLKMNKISIGKFRTKNGGTYTGLYATEDIKEGESIIEMPSDTLITVNRSWNSPLQIIYKENPDYYNPTVPNKWMDATSFITDHEPEYYTPYRYNLWEIRMNLLYLTHEHSKGEESELYLLFQNLPKEIDIIAYWEEEELQLFEDKGLIRFAKMAKDTIDEEVRQTIEIANKYPGIVDVDHFTYENVKRMYLCIHTRQYGIPNKFQTYAPIGEYFNHETVGVIEYLADETKTARPAFEVPAEYRNKISHDVEELPMLPVDDGTYTSDESYASQEFDQDSDFEYEDDIVPKDTVIFEEKKDQEEPEDMNLFAGEESLKMRVAQLRNTIINDLNWGDHVSVFFANEVLGHLKNLDKAFQAEKISATEVSKQLTEAEGQVAAFTKELARYNKDIVRVPVNDGDTPEQFDTINRKLKKKVIAAHKMRSDDQDWSLPKQTFGLRTTQAYKKHAQVHLFYGRNSNRYLNVNYGLAIEHNKYDNVHFKIPYFKNLTDKWLLEKVRYFKMSKVKKLKVRRRKFALELMTYFKALNWKYGVNSVDDLFYPRDLGLELKALETMRDHFQDFLKNCKKGEEELSETLKDPKLHYRAFFANVTNLERQRCIRFHLKAVLVLIEIVTRLMNGEKIEQATVMVPEFETVDEHHRNRNFLLNYMVRFSSKNP